MSACGTPLQNMMRLFLNIHGKERVQFMSFETLLIQMELV